MSALPLTVTPPAAAARLLWPWEAARPMAGRCRQHQLQLQPAAPVASASCSAVLTCAPVLCAGGLVRVRWCVFQRKKGGVGRHVTRMMGRLHKLSADGRWSGSGASISSMSCGSKQRHDPRVSHSSRHGASLYTTTTHLCKCWVDKTGCRLSLRQARRRG